MDEAGGRISWTPELHEEFRVAVEQAGGAAQATPKQIMQLMPSKLTLRQVKSYLQRFRNKIAKGGSLGGALGGGKPGYSPRGSGGSGTTTCTPSLAHTPAATGGATHSSQGQGRPNEVNSRVVRAGSQAVSPPPMHTNPPGAPPSRQASQAPQQHLLPPLQQLPQAPPLAQSQAQHVIQRLQPSPPPPWAADGATVPDISNTLFSALLRSSGPALAAAASSAPPPLGPAPPLARPPLATGSPPAAAAKRAGASSRVVGVPISQPVLPPPPHAALAPTSPLVQQVQLAALQASQPDHPTTSLDDLLRGPLSSLEALLFSISSDPPFLKDTPSSDIISHLSKLSGQQPSLFPWLTQSLPLGEASGLGAALGPPPSATTGASAPVPPEQQAAQQAPQDQQQPATLQPVPPAAALQLPEAPPPHPFLRSPAAGGSPADSSASPAEGVGATQAPAAPAGLSLSQPSTLPGSFGLSQPSALPSLADLGGIQALVAAATAAATGQGQPQPLQPQPLRPLLQGQASGGAVPRGNGTTAKGLQAQYEASGEAGAQSAPRPATGAGQEAPPGSPDRLALKQTLDKATALLSAASAGAAAAVQGKAREGPPHDVAMLTTMSEVLELHNELAQVLERQKQLQARLATAVGRLAGMVAQPWATAAGGSAQR